MMYMKVFWSEISVHAIYKSGGEPIVGWQDLLQNAVMGNPGRALTIASEYGSRIVKGLSGIKNAR